MNNKITIEEVKILYDFGEKFYNKQISLKDATLFLENQGIKRSSAVDYLYNYKNLILGKVFHRRISNLYAEYFLDKTLKEKGEEALLKALQSLSFHIDYYEGLGKNVISQKEILEKYKDKISLAFDNYFDEANNIVAKNLFEGALKTVKINIYERNGFARKKCLEHHGCSCAVCNFNFKEMYGEIGENFIHVHHLIKISDIKKEYNIDYKKDLIPVCPNCHAMIHKRKEPYTIEELKSIIENK